MLDRKQAEKVKAINPEPLLEALQQPKPEEKPPELKQQQQPQPPPPPPARPGRPQQVVEIVKPKDEREPANARLLSEYNSTSRSRRSRAARERADGRQEQARGADAEGQAEGRAARSSSRSPIAIAARTRTRPTSPGTLSMRNPGAQSPAETEQEQTRARLDPGDRRRSRPTAYPRARAMARSSSSASERREIPSGENGAGGGAPSAEPQAIEDVLERALGGGSVDHLDDVDNGDETALVVEALGLRELLQPAQAPGRAELGPGVGVAAQRSDRHGLRLQDPGHRGPREPVAKGDLDEDRGDTPSGVTELDDEAVRAFHAGGAVPEPAEGARRQATT